MSTQFGAQVRHEAVTNGITNCFFNGVIAWFLVRTKEMIPVWGGQGLLVDFFATGLILLFIVTLIVVPLSRASWYRCRYPLTPMASLFAFWRVAI